ncbi:hypothetical protein RRG08_007643 [Elysia crispata]|uniref:Uncharacterized protein n=1 Tax=Elysia crispata TaxID=231223 RepID=A0AAE0Y3G7_9GAST|nr:hypothetical protein RRG08_007643 [Elysia crispata]
MAIPREDRRPKKQTRNGLVTEPGARFISRTLLFALVSSSFPAWVLSVGFVAWANILGSIYNLESRSGPASRPAELRVKCVPIRSAYLGSLNPPASACITTT